MSSICRECGRSKELCICPIPVYTVRPSISDMGIIYNSVDTSITCLGCGCKVLSGVKCTCGQTTSKYVPSDNYEIDCNHCGKRHNKYLLCSSGGNIMTSTILVSELEILYNELGTIAWVDKSIEDVRKYIAKKLKA